MAHVLHTLMSCVASLQEKQQAREEQLADLQEQVQAQQHRRCSLEVALKAAEQVRAHGGLLVSASPARAHSNTIEDASHALTDSAAGEVLQTAQAAAMLVLLWTSCMHGVCCQRVGTPAGGA